MQILDTSDPALTAGVLEVEGCVGDKCTLSKQKGVRFNNQNLRTGDVMVFGTGVMLGEKANL